uniref:Nucleoside triphosphate pyrophosphohydrolase n=1 Tax=candidate division WOR-3 bacterium TaxID=2052148 RepID=A0A7C6EHV6_UNCW3
MKKNVKNTKSVSALIKLVRTLRKKCPWDRKQTLNSMRNNIIEEAYEVVDAIEKKDISSIKEEIGDLLFLGIFLSQLLESRGVNLKEIISDTIRKYKTKHPHVFKSKRFKNTKEIVKFWHSSKKDIFQGIPYSLPALLAARLIQERAARVGFDWNNPDGPMQKLIEEIKELEKTGSKKETKEEMGDLLFSCVNLARHLKIDPEDALRQANKKFVKRFRLMQKRIKKENRELSSLSLEEMDRVWNKIKKS